MLNLTKLTQVLQVKIDALATTSEFKELLLLAKAIEAAAGNATVSEILTTGATQAEAITDLAAQKVTEIGGAASIKIAEIQALAAVLKSGGVMTGPLQVPAGTAATPSLQVGNSTTGAYQAADGALVVLCNAVEALRLSAGGSALLAKALIGQVVPVTWASTITIDAAKGNYFVTTLAGTTTIANPTNVTAGQPITLILQQDATGSRTGSWGSAWKFAAGVAPSLSTAAGKKDRIVGHAVSGTEIHASIVKGF